MGYSKRLHQLQHGVLFHLQIEGLELLKLANSNVLGMWKFCDLTFTPF